MGGIGWVLVGHSPGFVPVGDSTRSVNLRYISKLWTGFNENLRRYGQCPKEQSVRF